MYIESERFHKWMLANYLLIMFNKYDWNSKQWAPCLDPSARREKSCSEQWEEGWFRWWNRRKWETE